MLRSCVSSSWNAELLFVCVCWWDRGHGSSVETSTSGVVLPSGGEKPVAIYSLGQMMKTVLRQYDE